MERHLLLEMVFLSDLLVISHTEQLINMFIGIVPVSVSFQMQIPTTPVFRDGSISAEAAGFAGSGHLKRRGSICSYQTAQHLKLMVKRGVIKPGVQILIRLSFSLDQCVYSL